MKHTVLVALVLLLGVTTTYAKVEAVAIMLSYDPVSTNDVTYTVPTNKILIIEGFCHQQQADDVGTELNIMMMPPSVGVWFYFGTTGTLPGGWTLSFHRTSGTESYITMQRVIICGKLVDHQDLYAKIDNKTKYLKASGSNLQMEIALASPRPSVVGLEVSYDLKNWMEDLEALVTHGNTTSNRVVERPFTEDKAYFRVNARARAKP